MARPLTALGAGPFGLGCASLGNLFRAMSDEDAEATLEAAWAAGVRWFDTAPHYGLGLSERRLGSFLRGKPRDEYLLSTKVGRRLEPLPLSDVRDDEGFEVPASHRRIWDFSAEGVEKTLAGSMDRLGVERVDIVLLHDPSDHLDRAVSEAVPALRRLQHQGIVGAVGAGTRDLDALEHLIDSADLDLVMTAGRYTLLDQSADDRLLPACATKGVTAVNVGVFNSGILATNTPPESATFEYARADPLLLAQARAIATICQRHGTTLPAAALAFAAAHPAIGAIAIGAASPEEVRADNALHDDPPSRTLWLDLAAEGLLGAAALRRLIEGHAGAR